MITITRIYIHGDVVNQRFEDSQRAYEHIEFLKKYRKGCAILLDGKCIYKGYFSDQSIKKYERINSSN